MRSNLDHLPASKQRELERVRQLIFEEFEDVTALASAGRKRAGRILKVILYGSYARGGWVDEPHTAKGYKSDFDLLIIVNHKDLTDRVKYWSRLDERLMREYGITGTLKTPVNFIVHTLGEVNDGLAHGRYFFMDVARDGIAIYEADDSELHTPKPKTPEQALAMAKEYLEEWYPAALRAHVNFRDDLGRGWNNDAAFMLHQATERFYHCALLVLTFYTPHVHNLAFLRTQAERIDRRLAYIWPSENRKQRAMFEKLKEAYVKARYSKHYRISGEELAWLGEQIEELGRVVHIICIERIAALEDQAGTRAATRAGQ
ncbi:nucleotidyltransferase and HEPN domain-containing protein [Novosphingobium subterraneum]|jgi:predicted nucleotidyltransferase/HEPN domain-containing protein|uniref:Putative nucleotidyltransferase n=1 Tax=Novosphingobium subterraneum TaxID=48936 RepID=A0A0B8Z9L6_9SPHN|nr:nucleotidyltransferase and HEPN domain-containing protein [Novosphingobium subterraneum]KHS42921.1 putative nucleotidyltransferase [Novosphingobium subterraneum]